MIEYLLSEYDKKFLLDLGISPDDAEIDNSPATDDMLFDYIKSKRDLGWK